jgi:phosphatidate cytidylyltransferase
MDDEHDPEEESTAPAPGRVRIVGAEPAGSLLGSGTEPEGDRDAEADEAAPAESPLAEAGGTELPHWTEAPTGEIPSVLSRASADDADESDPWSSMPGPTWREEDSDWEAHEETFEPSMLAEDKELHGSLDESSEPGERQPWTFDLPSAEEPTAPPVAPEELLLGDDDTMIVPAVRRPGAPEEVAFHFDEVDASVEPEPAAAPTAQADTDVELGAAAAVAAAETSDRPPTRRGLGRHGLRLGALHHVATSDGQTEEMGAAQVEGDDGDVAEDAAAAAAVAAVAARPPRVPGKGKPRRQPPAERPVPVVDGVEPASEPRQPPPPPSGRSDRNLPVAVASGVVLGALALLCFKLGTVTSMLAVCVVGVLAAIEVYAAFRRAGYHPATLLGLAATLSVLIATYQKGQEALPLVMVVLFAFTMLWQLAGVDRAAEPLRSVLSTLFVFLWIGVFGSYAALLLNPTLFPHRHGIAFLLGALIAAVAYDIGALATGRAMGRRPLTAMSPNKTWEGLIGGAVAAVVASVVIVHLIYPWTLGAAFVLGVVVAVVSPIGDLSESLVKRSLGLKDMGRILPGHGGLVDRMDGVVFVLPATYYLVKAFHLG